MRIIFIGTVEFSKEALVKILALHGNVVGICTLRASKFNSDFCDLSHVAEKHKIPIHYVEDINSNESIEWISQKKPDVICCFGWSRLLKDPILSMAPLGVVGFHPAALPANRGRHPIIWAIVLGLKETASTFFFMDSGADSGDILSQRAIKIDSSDDAGTLYSKVVNTALLQIEEFLPQLEAKTYSRQKQDTSFVNSWRKRGKADGRIDWRMPASGIHNLVRGLTRPYVGAHFELNQVEYKVWRAELVNCLIENIEPGKVLSISNDFQPVVKCGIHAIKLLEVEPKVRLEVGDYL